MKCGFWIPQGYPYYIFTCSECFCNVTECYDNCPKCKSCNVKMSTEIIRAFGSGVI